MLRARGRAARSTPDGWYLASFNFLRSKCEIAGSVFLGNAAPAAGPASPTGSLPGD